MTAVGGAPLRIQPKSFGPFVKGVIDTANAALGNQGALRYARGLTYSGMLKQSVRPGTVLALTLTDDTETVTVLQATGPATGGTLATLADSAQSWSPNQWAGQFVEVMSGPGVGQRGLIASNTATTLTVSSWNDVPALAVAPTLASTYRILHVQAPGAGAITNVVALAPFADVALAVGYSSATGKCYLYQLASTMDGWYDATNVLHAGSLSPKPVGVLWTAMTAPPVVTIAEGLGTAYIAHRDALDQNGLYWQSQTFTIAGGVVPWTNDFGDGAGAVGVYFTSVASFQQAVWGSGFGAGVTAATAYRPELLRFSPPDFGTLAVADSLTIGNRVRSQRERTVGLGATPNALVVGGNFLVTRITGYGRDTWYREILDQSHGFVGPLCWATDGEYCYYWSRRGPLRVGASGPVDALWLVIEALAARVVNPQTIVCFRDEPRDLIVWLVDTGAGVRTRVAYDVSRGLFSATDDDIGLVMSCGAEIDPVIAPPTTTPATYPPAGPPIAAVTTLIGTTVATASWTPGDPTAQTEVWLQRVVDPAPTRLAVLAPNVNTYTFGGLDYDTPYQWQVRHVRNGVFSSYLGPTGFTTLVSTAALLPPSNLSFINSGVRNVAYVAWTNSGETDVQTEIWVCGPVQNNTQPPPFPAGGGHVNDTWFLAAVANPTVASDDVLFDPGLAPGAPLVGYFLCLIRHVRAGSTPSPLAPAVTFGPFYFPASVFVNE